MSHDDERAIRVRIRAYVTGKRSKTPTSEPTMSGDPKPVIHCFAARAGRWAYSGGMIHCVSLETAEWMRQIGYVIVGPDPHDMIALALWEKAQAIQRTA